MMISIGVWDKPKRRMSEQVGTSIIMATAIAASGCDTALAYTPGQIIQRSEPIIAMIRELADPVAYGTLTWACIRYMLHQRGEAIDMIKSVAWGYALIQLSPTAMNILKEIR